MPQPSKNLAAILNGYGENEKRGWLDKRLNLEPTHPDLHLLEDAIFRFACEFAANPRRGRRIVIHGANGTGKSRSMRAIKRFIDDRAIDMPLIYSSDSPAIPDCVLVNWPARVDEFKSGLWTIDDLCECALLLLDDLGAEHDPSGVGTAKLYQILERRECRWTIITSNLTPDYWTAKWERRITDRLLRRAQLVDLSNVPSYSPQT